MYQKYESGENQPHLKTKMKEISDKKKTKFEGNLNLLIRRCLKVMLKFDEFP